MGGREGWMGEGRGGWGEGRGGWDSIGRIIILC